jgi:arginyl-tRNA synthetase
MNKLASINEARRQEVETFRNERVAAHRMKSLPKFGEYPLVKLKERIADALSERWRQGRLEIEFELILREKFGGDIALKCQQILQDVGPRRFIEDHQPWIVEVLNGETFSDSIARVETKGMYINLTLSDRWLLNSAQTVVDLGSNFGLSDTQADRTIIVDYSSPNVAKVLHAGHIRSTIIGHVLSNLHEACGALVYRINHINDFGGFGFNLEGYRRFKDQFPPDMSNNEQLLENYRIRRTMERLVKAALSLDMLDEEDRGLLARYFPNVRTVQELKEVFDDFIVASDRRFARLEAGIDEEVDLWEQMVRWSLEDFERFYKALNIRIDLVLGESFYFQVGNALIDTCIECGKAMTYTPLLAERDIHDLDAQLAGGEITQSARNSLAESIRKDIGAVVVPLDDNRERYIVRHADGRSIYSTRDLAAIVLRVELFAPTDITYVVGQEQQVHFSRLFTTAYAIGIIAPDVRLKHLYFGFYVDAQTGKKLSSRDTVSNVNHLITESIEYFRSRLSMREDQTATELDNAARQLAIGSLVFNDLKQDMKGSVEIDSTNLENTIVGFEKSGGAYMVYSVCRARSIIRKHGVEPTPAHRIKQFEIDAQEAALLLKVQQIPEKVAIAADQANPSILLRHLLDTAAIYNSYYARAPVIVDGVANQARLLITMAIQQSLANGLSLCHVDCPPKI